MEGITGDQLIKWWLDRDLGMGIDLERGLDRNAPGSIATGKVAR